MSYLTRRSHLGPFTGIHDWLESPLDLVRAVTGNAVPIEDYIEDGRYVLRAELPGMDPRRDMDVTISNGILTIRADRTDKTEGAHRSEFRYGVFTRSVALPQDAAEGHVQATYGNGILEITVPLDEPSPARQRVHITVDQHIPAT